MNYCNPVLNNGGVLSDFDKQGLIKAYGGQNIAGTSTAPGTQFQGDVDGDGFDDNVFLYDYGSEQMGIWASFGSPGGLQPPVQLWRSAPGDWRWELAKPLVGDFDGDGRSDIGIFYNYGNSNSAIWVFYSSGRSLAAPKMVWWGGIGNWAWERSLPVAGDFDGDGATDIAVFYDYSYDDTGLWRFTFKKGIRDVIAPPTLSWRSGQGQWRWSSIKAVTGHFFAGEGRMTDILAFYDYGNSDTGSWVFKSNTSGFYAPTARWRSGAGNWAWSRSKIVSADFNGNGITDVGVLYDYDNSDSALWMFLDTSNYSILAWRSGAGGWYSPGTQLIGGRFTGGAQGQVAAFYDYGSSTSSTWLFKGGASWAPVAQWYSGVGNWSAPRTKFF